MRNLVIGPIAFAFVAAAHAQDGPAAATAPKTKIEAFTARKGSLVTKQFDQTCTFPGDLTGTIEVNVLTVTEAGKEAARLRGLTAEVKEMGRLERENTCFLDADEADALASGIAYMTKQGETWQTAAPPVYTEVVFDTKGDFHVAIFAKATKDGKARVSMVVSCGRIGKTSLIGGMADLAKLSACVSDSITKLKAAQ